jgi:hypothetical protein
MSSTRTNQSFWDAKEKIQVFVEGNGGVFLVHTGVQEQWDFF